MSCSHPVRINKRLSEAGVCSRRQADRLILQGKVMVNGATAKPGMLIKPQDRIEIDGRPLPNDPEPVYLLYHKPVGITCTHDRAVPGNLEAALDYPQRVFAVGRLDKNSEGLLLLTNQGDIVNKIMRVENGHEKTYLVTVDKPLTEEFVERMSSGVAILDTVTRPCKVEPISERGFRITLTQGLNLQIRRMAKALGYRVLTLKRIRIMDLELEGLAPGQWRNLEQDEVQRLYRMLENSTSESQE